MMGILAIETATDTCSVAVSIDGLIAYGCGPGSFTGLRIAASAVQGLAYSCGLPAVAVSTLAVLAQNALRKGEVNANEKVLCTLDARINEVYSAVYQYENDLALLCEGPWACAPNDLALEKYGPLTLVGDGDRFLEHFPETLRAKIVSTRIDIVPLARDMIPLALAKFQKGDIQSAEQVQPIYVRDEISWKKLAQQGKPR
jgi:tRNA threonylcarbamoyladenosine biosynthesis protein TsaB